MPQPEKSIIFPHGTTGLVDIIFRIHRDRDDYLLDNDDGTFSATPVDADIPAVEDPDNDGVYLHNEDREDWEFENAMYTVYAYQGADLIGEGKLKLHYGRGSATVNPIGGAGGAAPLPAGASTSAKQDTVIASLGGSTNYLRANGTTNPIATGVGPYTGDVAIGFDSIAITIVNDEPATDMEYSFDAGTTYTTLKAGEDISLPVKQAAVKLKSAKTGHLYRLIAL